jgi:hypothetical protein
MRQLKKQFKRLQAMYPNEYVALRFELHSNCGDYSNTIASYQAYSSVAPIQYFGNGKTAKAAVDDLEKSNEN